MVNCPATGQDCTVALANFAIGVTCTGALAPVRYTYDVAGFSPTRLLPGEVEYQKR